jgi:hypothetical protein
MNKSSCASSQRPLERLLELDNYCFILFEKPLPRPLELGGKEKFIPYNTFTKTLTNLTN